MNEELEREDYKGMFTTPRTDQYFTPSNQYIYTLYHAYIIILPDHSAHLYLPPLALSLSLSPSLPRALWHPVSELPTGGKRCVWQGKGVREGRVFKQADDFVLKKRHIFLFK